MLHGGRKVPIRLGKCFFGKKQKKGSRHATLWRLPFFYFYDAGIHSYDEWLE